MKGLILKDLLNLRKTIRTSLIIGIAYSIFFASFDTSFIIGILALMFTMQALTTFSYDEFAKWDIYALSLPISRKQLVLSKYIVSFTLMISGLLLSLAITSILAFLHGTFDFIELISGLFGFSIVMVFMLITLIPLIYKFGIERGRIMIIGIFAIPSLIILVIVKLLNGMNIALPSPEVIEMVLKIAPYFIVVLLAIFTYLSYRISIKIVSKKQY